MISVKLHSIANEKNYGMLKKSFLRDCTGRQFLIIVLLSVLIGGLSSCRRDIERRELISNYEGTSFSEVFTAFWTGLNSNYMFWDGETVNWDSAYRAYKPKFGALDKLPYSDTIVNRCFQYMADMTKDLHDGQFALQVWSGGDYRFEDSLYKNYISFIPKLQRTQRIRPALPDSLFDYIIQNNYLNNFDYGLYRSPTTDQIFQIISGRISKGAKNILYTNVNMFNMKEAYNASYASRPPRPVIKNLFDNIHKSSCDGIIIDLRNNRGGNLEDVDFLVGQFTTKPVLYGYVRYRSGGGRLDYTVPLPLNITPQPGSSDFKKPIVLLTDIYSAALSEAVIQAFQSLPDVKVMVVGEHTYGTSGIVVANGNDISTNGGNFNVGAFGSIRISNAALQDKNHHFNFSGISPDIEVKYSAASIDQMLHSGVDIQLEKAIQYFNK
jgi:carboxyl-terminal processing protease